MPPGLEYYIASFSPLYTAVREQGFLAMRRSYSSVFRGTVVAALTSQLPLTLLNETILAGLVQQIAPTSAAPHLQHNASQPGRNVGRLLRISCANISTLQCQSLCHHYSRRAKRVPDQAPIKGMIVVKQILAIRRRGVSQPGQLRTKASQWQQRPLPQRRLPRSTSS